MNFNDFQASRRYSADLYADLPEARDYLLPGTKGFIYTLDCYIEELSVAHPQGRYCLEIYGEQTVSDDLEALERRLYDWADGELFFAEDET